MRTMICAAVLGLGLSLAASSANAQSQQQVNAAKLIQLILVIAATDRHESVNINKADAKTLQDKLPGVSTDLSQAIVQFREDNGPFQSLLELLEVDGMNKELVIQNQKLMTL